MDTQLEEYKKYFFAGLILIALGIVFRDDAGSLGTVLIALGGLLFIVAMSKKRKENEEKNN